MDKKIALINLIENSFVVGNKMKRKLLEKVEYMTDDEVNKLGKFFVSEREFILKDEAGFIAEVDKVIKSIAQ